MYKTIKRVFDILIAIVALVICIPIFIPVMLILRFSGEGEVFYLQERVGYGNELFPIWKFATMLKNSPSLGTGDVTVKNDPRVLPIGKFLRKSKINELPQIINVLNGSMSIVGARPLMPQSFNQYSDQVKAVIYQTPPGITGIGSLIFRDEESIIDKSAMDPRFFYENYILPYKGNLEVWYQARKSLMLDMKIIFLTAWLIVFPKSDIVQKTFKGLPQRTF
ncbi:MAG: sugar transferase [Chitinophagaceae bacterium]|nr:sugar transferase [Chitinophagaceae bacterium]